MTNFQVEKEEYELLIDHDNDVWIAEEALSDFREWLSVRVGDELPSIDGDINITVKEAKTDLKCRRCQKVIFTFCPYAQGTWRYSKYHIKCAKNG